MIPTTNTTIASAAEVESLSRLFPLELRGESSWHLFLCLNLGRDLLGSNSLGRASNNLAVFHESLDQEVILVFAQVALLNTVST